MLSTDGFSALASSKEGSAPAGFSFRFDASSEEGTFATTSLHAGVANTEVSIDAESDDAESDDAESDDAGSDDAESDHAGSDEAVSVDAVSPMALSTAASGSSSNSLSI